MAAAASPIRARRRCCPAPSAGSPSKRTSHDSGSQNAVAAGCVMRWTLISVSPALRNRSAAHRAVAAPEGKPETRPHNCPVPISGDLRLLGGNRHYGLQVLQDRGAVELGALRFSGRQCDRSWAARADDDRRGGPRLGRQWQGKPRRHTGRRDPCRGPGRRPAPRPRSPCTGECRWWAMPACHDRIHAVFMSVSPQSDDVKGRAEAQCRAYVRISSVVAAIPLVL